MKRCQKLSAYSITSSPRPKTALPKCSNAVKHVFKTIVHAGGGDNFLSFWCGQTVRRIKYTVVTAKPV